jgi:diaminopimelate epimerase
MHGLGNDFVIVDARHQSSDIDAARARAIADRRTGVGCDQLIVIEPPRDNLSDAFMRIYNADGGEVEACGNATRCVAALLSEEHGKAHVIVETVAGLLDAEVHDQTRITVDMGVARMDWRDIPLAKPMDPLRLDIVAGPLREATAVNVGNPHAVFFVEDVNTIDLPTFGPIIERHRLFPQYTNVEAVQVLAPDRLRVRVWERGVGVTQACGTGACAALVAASIRGLADRSATVDLDGGPLLIDWLRDGHVLMTGPATQVFSGHLHPSLFESSGDTNGDING